MATRPGPLQAIGIAGSPSVSSRSRVLVEQALSHLAARGVAGSVIDLIELPADALLARRYDDRVAEAIQHTVRADIVFIGTPVYRASYTGQLKAFLDLFPQDALRNHVVGLIATGAGPGHALLVDHALRPLVASLGGLTAAQGIYVTDAQFPDKARLPEEIERQIEALAGELYVLASGLAAARQRES